MKKYLFYILILTALIGFFSKSTETYAVLCDDFGQPAGCIQAPANTNCTPDDNGTIPEGCGYHLLAPIPCSAGSSGCVKGADGQYTFTDFDPTSTDGPNTRLGEYLNLMIKIFIGLCAVAAVGMIVIGGIEYMTSELISGKEAGKERIEHAILGLVIALSSYALLNTINPNLLNTDLESLKGVKVTINLDQQNFARTEKPIATVGTGYQQKTPASAGVSTFAANGSLDTITVDTTTRQATFCSGGNCVSVPVNLGYMGVSEAGQARSGDNKTPKGNTTISGLRLIASGPSSAVNVNNYNFGAAFINIGASINGIDRGIGFHGSYDDALATTAGCIRMNNADLALLAPLMRSGVRVTVK